MPVSASMGTKLKNLRPAEAFEDAVRRSLAAGAAGFLAFGALNTFDVIPAPYRSLVLVSGMEATFFVSLALLVAYYHARWILGFFGAVLFLFLPYAVNFVWIALSRRSLIYPVATLVIAGPVIVQVIHRRISGPQYEDDVEEQVIRQMIEEMASKITWVDRVTWLCFAVALALLFVLLLR
jgi:hypothetical protein